MKTIAALKTLHAALFSTLSGSREVCCPASVLCDRMLNDIGQYQVHELQEAASALSHRGGRFLS
ncbi:hypothetical protein Q5Y75_27815 [Ruegeria sp. 2205SS24-7]|uniref:hypothetical protein n=1 Tax=Ruegeria discodermiae TaxID=3064389 RepID=UPI0027405DA2|nr:hypothetical protein [Ruegeria sp. 2205SS24-7]MDP5220993.1 hypothetical protein [Ruegeria sp. 2205SS24-7]